MPFVATWMGPEIIILSEVSQKKTNTRQQHSYGESKKKKKKKKTNELIYKEIDSQTETTNLWLPKRMW